jgi:glycosyltransferase involved in cell wall biosynthesis
MFKKMYKPDKTDKIRLLVEGWFNIPHSYDLVACNELLALQRNFGDKLDIFISEQDYYRESWNDNRKLMYLPKKNKDIESLKVWKGEEIDVIYRITYPYNVTNKKYNRYNNKYIPTIVFYTAEFAHLDPSYFVFDNNFKFVDDNFISSFLENNPCYYFKTPSEWSRNGMKRYVSDERNTCITHGVDTSVFYRDTTTRSKVRKDWGFNDTDTILMTGGALTRNKGVPEVLVLLYMLVFKDGKTNTKLVLKGTGELYPSQQMVESYIDDLVDKKVMSRESASYLVKNHIKYLPKTVTEMSLRHLFNAVDIYVSPYLAEGFNLMVLEAISCGTKVLVSKGGCTDDYTNKVLENVPGASDYIHRFDTQVYNETKKHLIIDVYKLYNAYKEIDFTKQSDEYFDRVTKYVCDNLSWNSVSKQFFELISKVYGGVYKTGTE